MEVQFKRETLFEKFKLSSSFSKGELMKLFQTRPELRKELPVHIQTINSDAKLFVEELFSTYIDNDFYTVEKYVQDRKSVEQLESVFDTEITSSVSSRKKLAALINLVRNFDYAISKLKISGKVFDELVSVIVTPALLKKDLTYAKVDANGEIFSAFCESLWLEIENEINSSVNGLNSKTVNATYRVLSATTYTSLKKRFVTAFADAIATSLDSISSRLEDESLFTSSIEFVCGLNNSLFKNKEFYYSYKAFCNQLANNVDENGTLFFANFSKLLEKLHPEDAEHLCTVFINLCFTYILFDNIEKNTYYELSKMSSVSSVIDYIKDNDIECEHIEILEILSALIKNGEEWYNYYRERILAIKKGTSVSQNLYDLTRLLYKSERLKNYRTLFTNLLIALTRFDNVTENLFENLNRELASISNMGALGIYVIEKRQDELKNYILKYYALTILQSEIIKTFDEVYKLLTSNSYTAKTYMEKCDAVRGSHRTYPDTLEDAKNKAASRSSYSYPRSYSSSSSDCCGGCYVATCVYGSYDCPQVWTLRRFRDDTIGSTWYGRAFIKLYYAISPTLVKWFGKTKWFKKMWKGTLDRMVKKLNDKGVEDTPYKDKNWK